MTHNGRSTTTRVRAWTADAASSEIVSVVAILVAAAVVYAIAASM